MRHKLPRNLTAVITLVLVFVVVELLGTKAGAQGGGIRLRQPFDGTYRLTAYVDHRSPNYTTDGNVVVYNGEDRLNCPDCGQAWTTQGPYCYDGHNAVDYALPNNTVVLAAASGEVTSRGWRSNSYGNSIRIDHGNGYQTWYSHLAQFSVSLNDQVVAGQQIGLSGNSGQGQPYHLHFEVRHNGDVTDPFGWLGDWTDPLQGGPAICLWGDGQCSEIVVEDESDWFYKYGSGWQWYCRGNGWTMRYAANDQSGYPYTYARWRPYLPHGGPYSVFAFAPADHATTTNAEYVVHDKDGDHSVIINQNSHSNEWVYLGSYDFWGDCILGYVYLNNITGENDSTTDVCFDSVKFRQFRVYIPAVLKNYP